MNKRNLELDRLRGFAVIMTIAIHIIRVFFPWSIQSEYQHGTTILNIFANSWAGVDLFFVISGFIISKMIVEKIDSLKNSAQGLAYFVRNFFLRRIFRIYPVAWFVFLFVLICAVFFNETTNFGTVENTIEAGISIFTYTFNYFFAFGHYKSLALSPYWSLALEEQFYLLFPIFLIFTANNKQRVLMLLFAILIITFFVRPYSKFDSIFLTHSRCDGLLYGCLVYFLSTQSWFNYLVVRFEGNILNSIITLLLVFVLSGVTALGFSNNVVIPLVCLLSALMVALAAMEKNIITVFAPFSTILNYLGSRSYSLYIVHFPMMVCTQEIIYRLSRYYQFDINANLTFYYLLLVSALTLFSSEILYKYIEIPFIRRGRVLSDSSNILVSKNQSIITVQN